MKSLLDCYAEESLNIYSSFLIGLIKLIELRQVKSLYSLILLN